MLEVDLARLRAHRNNIHRYRRLLETHLSELERDYVSRRLSEEEGRFEQLAASTCPFSLIAGMPNNGADNHA